MENITKTPEQLAELNKYNHNYITHFSEPINMKLVYSDLEILKDNSVKFKLREQTTSPIIGECLHLPDGQKVFFCHLWDDHVQTCKSGSFCLTNSGYISHSGGLDSGIKLDDIELTAEKDVLPIWFYHRGYLTGGCAIYANIEVRVWKPKQNADLSGIPQIEELRRKKLKESSEKIRSVDGNGNEYFEHLPSVYIMQDSISEDQLKNVEKQTGLKFETGYYVNLAHWCQPMTIKQIEQLKSFDFLHFEEERRFTNYEYILVARKSK